MFILIEYKGAEFWLWGIVGDCPDCTGAEAVEVLELELRFQDLLKTRLISVSVSSFCSLLNRKISTTFGQYGLP